MSKTLEKNSVWVTARRSWKRFVAWVTALHTKYQTDLFFRTEFNVITLQIIFAVALSVLVAVSFNFLYKDLLNTILTGIAKNIEQSGTFSAQNIVDSLHVAKTKNFALLFIAAVSITLLFSYLIARLTLVPARNALKSQKRFVSDIAHELRTPLAVIKTNIEVAMLDESLNHEARKIFKSSIEELDRASGIINNLLTFNMLVRPEQIKFVSVNMAHVVETSISKLEDLAKKKDIKLTIKKVGPSNVWGNVTALEQIVTNIVKNAINYTQAGGAIVVTLEPDYQGNITFSVTDNGIGISEKDLLHIFEPFYRAERSRNRQLGSSGLGLTIVSELVKLHLGKISVKSRMKYGTTVTVILPYNKDSHEKKSLIESDGFNNEVAIDFLKRKQKN